nr:hypothetical protein Iba_chr04cCG4830 [Ipomoea batatas]GMC89831.1 hypothetical protein Iba_chr04fCG2510 [Ipomoea batatas]
MPYNKSHRIKKNISYAKTPSPFLPHSQSPEAQPLLQSILFIACSYVLLQSDNVGVVKTFPFQLLSALIRLLSQPAAAPGAELRAV